MTNPNNAIGTNGAYGGRTSVNAFNDNLAIYQGRGILSGFVVSPNTGMSVAIGGDGTTRDVAIAEDNIGNKTTINNISESPVVLNIAGAPASNSRIDAIVAYVDNPAQGSATETDNPSACGLLDVQGSVSASPSQPDENAIRTAITADGASGTTAYYVVLGYVTITNGTTDITSNMINQVPVKIILQNTITSPNSVGISALKRTVLYNNPSGWTSGPITLSESIDNFARVEVIFADTDSNNGLETVNVKVNGISYLTCTTIQPGIGNDRNVYGKSARISITGTSATILANKEWAIVNAANGIVSTDGSHVKIFSIVGYSE